MGGGGLKFKKKFLAGTQQVGRSFVKAVEKPSRTFTLHAGAGWPFNHALVVSWAILSVWSQGKLLPSFTIYNVSAKVVLFSLIQLGQRGGIPFFDKMFYFGGAPLNLFFCVMRQ
jgi:hypothetical protein